MKYLSLIVLSLALSECVPSVWVKAGATSSEFVNTKEYCTVLAHNMRTPYYGGLDNTGGYGVHGQQVFDDCMHDRGWNLVSE